MSRGFVKEAEEIPEPVVVDSRRERQLTERGFAAFEREFALTRDPARRSLLEQLLAVAVVPALPDDRSRIAFGATVTVSGMGTGLHEYAIVGDDEIDVEAGRIGAGSPLALALLGAVTGDEVIWQRPNGAIALMVRSVRFES